MKLTIALQDEMMVESSPVGKGGNIVIDIPDTCKRDLWQAQLEYWLEDGNKKADGGFLRMIKNKIKHVRTNY